MGNGIIRKIVLVIAAAIVLILGMVGVIQYVEESQKNTWVCVSGEWLKHGNPTAPKPTTGCGE